MKPYNKPPLLSWIDLFITERCNLKCRYCFHIKKPKDMEGKTIEKTLETLGRYFRNPITFNMFGGEPFLRADFCWKWIQEIKKRIPFAKFHVSTNATILNEDVKKIITYLRDDPDSVFQVSYDGINQEQLRGMRSVVEENIKEYLKLYSPKQMNIRLTYTRDTVKDLAENVKYVYGLGARKFSHQNELNKDWNDGDFAIYREQLEQIYEFVEQHQDFYLQFCDCDRMNYEKDNARCGVGRSLIAVDAIGDIYPCQRLIKYPNLKIGNVYEGWMNRGKHLQLKILGCEDCRAVSTCHSCMAAFYEYNGSLVEPLKACCEINRIEYDKAKTLYMQKYPELLEVEDVLVKSLAVLEDIRTVNKTILDVVGVL